MIMKSLLALVLLTYTRVGSAKQEMDPTLYEAQLYHASFPKPETVYIPDDRSLAAPAEVSRWVDNASKGIEALSFPRKEKGALIFAVRIPRPTADTRLFTVELVYTDTVLIEATKKRCLVDLYSNKRIERYSKRSDLEPAIQETVRKLVAVFRKYLERANRWKG